MYQKRRSNMGNKIQWLATVVLTLAGVALLCAPAHAQGGASAPSPTRFTVADQGTPGKPDLILIPGLGSSRAVWDAEAARLAPNYRLHILQVNGFAGAPEAGNATGPMLPGIVAELHQYIAANNLHPIVIGHSLGGLLTLMLADKYPQDVRKIVMVDSLPSLAAFYLPNATPETVRPMAEAMRGAIAGGSAESFAAQSKSTTASMVNNPDAQKLVTAAAIASNQTVFANAMAEDLETDLRGEVASIKTPALLLYPYDAALQGPDPAKTDTLYQSQYKPMPNVKLVRIDNSRHFILYDQPAKLDDALEVFLK